MKRIEVVLLALSLLVTASTHAAAQDLEFTLDEVDGASAPPKKGKSNGKGKGSSKPEPPAIDVKAVIAQELGGVRWGMSKGDVIKALKAQIRAEFEQRIKVERDIMRQDALYQEANEQYRRLSENYVSFEGKKSGWDVSPVGREFTHGNRETMLVVTRRGSRDMYFFIQGRLWKWYRELTPDSLNVEDPADGLTVLRTRFGTGKTQTERRTDSNLVFEGTTWTDGATRVTAMLRGGDTCLIFEDVRTIEQLAVLRHSVQPNGGKRGSSSVIDSVLLTDAELEARNR